VEHPAVDDGVRGEAEAAEVKRVSDLEPRVQSPRGGFRPCPRDRGRRDVNAGDVRAPSGRQQRVLPGPAAGVEKPPAQASLVSEPDEGRLRPADVPQGRRGRRLAGVPRLVFLLRHQSAPSRRRGPRPVLVRVPAAYLRRRRAVPGTFAQDARA
jgi:hypothetical protein